MSTYNSILWQDCFNTLISFVIGLMYRIIKTCQLSQIFQIIIHLLIAYNRKYFSILEVKIFVFIVYRFAFIVKFNNNSIIGFYRNYIYVRVFYV